jgi:hypothetical protein
VTDKELGHDCIPIDPFSRSNNDLNLIRPVLTEVDEQLWMNKDINSSIFGLS